MTIIFTLAQVFIQVGGAWASVLQAKAMVHETRESLQIYSVQTTIGSSQPLGYG
jgi:hypothetical protein